MRTAIFLLVAVAALTGCSAAIMATAPSKSSLVRDGAHRAEIRKALGEPVAVESFEKPTPILTPKGGNPYELVFMEAGDGPSIDSDFGPQILATSMETYRFAGLVKGEHDTGELTAMAGYTFGLSEILAAPLLAKERVMSGSIVNTVWVWYSDSGTALAYLFKQGQLGGEQQ